MAAFAAGFFDELEGFDGDGFIEGFGHVVDGEGGDGGGGKGFHFDSGGAGGAGGSGDFDAVAAGFEVDIDVGEGEGVAKGDQVSSAFGGLDAGEAGNFKGVALGVGREGEEDLAGEPDESGGAGCAGGWGFA